MMLIKATRTLAPRGGARAYHALVVDHFEKPLNVGSLDKNDPNVGTGLVGAPACGDVMKLQIRVDDDGNIIDSKFKTFGCGSAIASSSVASEWVKGRSIEGETITNKVRLFGLLSNDPIEFQRASSHQLQRL
ncbi:NifU-like N terminal domain-containing protein [Pelagophyceae sp. CCMP2097]|nr:NifU-like N terminal domain-containing protein [Pelagophyceae sp. CCMP2097]